MRFNNFELQRLEVWLLSLLVVLRDAAIFLPPTWIDDKGLHVSIFENDLLADSILYFEL
jgi:hypothetical protein